MIAVIIGSILVAAVTQSGLGWYVPQAVYMMIIPDGSGATTTHVADVWQEWTVRFKDGHSQSFRSDFKPISFQTVPTSASGEPSVLDITFSIKLQYRLRMEESWPLYKWDEVLKVDPIMTVLVDGRGVGAVSTFEPIVFTSDDALGTVKTWTARVVFQGQSGAVSYPTVNAVNALAGKQQAFVQVIMSELWTQYRAWWYSAESRQCGVVVVGGHCWDELSRKTEASPYGLNFIWTPTATGTATFTWPTAILTTDTGGNPVVVYTVTGTKTFLLWRTVTATFVGPTETVTITVGTNIGGTPSPEPSNYCGKDDSFSKFMCWVSRSTGILGYQIPNWLILVVVLVVILWLISRLFTPRIQVGGS